MSCKYANETEPYSKMFKIFFDYFFCSCCPMYNQRKWTTGKFISGNECERCQCYGHADECYFDPQIESERKSQNTAGKFSGGGVCIKCRDNTDGVNCERCLPGNDLTIGWQNLNLLSQPSATPAPQARASGD